MLLVSNASNFYVFDAFQSLLVTLMGNEMCAQRSLRDHRHGKQVGKLTASVAQMSISAVTKVNTYVFVELQINLHVVGRYCSSLLLTQSFVP